MSNSPQSTAKEAALQLTLAALARMDLNKCSASTAAANQGSSAASAVNALYNSILANLEKKQ